MLLVPETLRTRGREGAVAEEHSTDGWGRDKGGCANPETRNLRGGRARPRPKLRGPPPATASPAARSQAGSSSIISPSGPRRYHSPPKDSISWPSGAAPA